MDHSFTADFIMQRKEQKFTVTYLFWAEFDNRNLGPVASDLGRSVNAWEVRIFRGGTWIILLL